MVLARLGEALKFRQRSSQDPIRVLLLTRTRPSFHGDDGAPSVEIRLDPPSPRANPSGRSRDGKHRLMARAGSLPKRYAAVSSLLLAVALVAIAGLRSRLRFLAAIHAKAAPDLDLIRGEPAVLVAANVPSVLAGSDLLSCGHGLPLSSPLRLRTHEPTTSRRRLVKAVPRVVPGGFSFSCDVDPHLRDAGAVTGEQGITPSGGDVVASTVLEEASCTTQAASGRGLDNNGTRDTVAACSAPAAAKSVDGSMTAELQCHPEVRLCRVCIEWLMPRAGGLTVTPTLPVTDMDEAVRFYEAAGFEVRRYDEGFAFVTRNDQSTFDLDLAPHIDPTANGSGCYIIIDCVDEWHRTLAAAGLDVTAVADMPWRIREFTLTDPSGNHIRIGRTASCLRKGRLDE